ncbi:hypothetical protein GGX14DRAFT_430976 [Mycena pura]|uniref:JmjC domain-containing protein n=1 Tax=Mycena pura TaxID=153505 RepID=A0AAD6VXF8_9AGAR|nr:hypothetical protein GGX14DRAFT_430976 [Mycena pura]
MRRTTVISALESTLSDIAPCGLLFDDLLTALSAIKAGLARNPDAVPVEGCDVDAALSACLDNIVAQAYANLARTSLLCWGRLHTDASILSALVSPPLDAVAKLDTAIIVSGAAGERRLDLILDIIHHIQSEHFPFQAFRSTSSAYQAPRPPEISGRAIPCPAAPPSLAAFQSRDHCFPFILRDYVSRWPALNERPWASLEYLRAVAGHGRVVPIEVGRDYRTDNWSQKLVGWDAFLSSLDSNTDGEPLYLAQHSLLLQFPALRADIEIPDYVYADIPRPPGCEPPSNDEQLVINAWLGPEGTVSPAHTDPYFNMYAQVVGRKTVWVASPSCSGGMYATGNTSAVDVFSTEQDCYPDFTKLVAGQSMLANLAPGDLLYIPAGWWHAMRADCRSFSVSMWF